ncbi:MAG: hypothetical protein ACYC54_14335 [Sedimentisphaerales bacterium]
MKNSFFGRVVPCFVLVFVLSVNFVQADYSNDFEDCSIGVFLDQSDEWLDYGAANDCESPMVTDARQMSGSKSICNNNDPQSSTDETSTMMKAYLKDVAYGNDVSVEFYFCRIVEQGDPSWNKVRLDIFDTAGERFAVSAYNGRIYDENNNWNIVENVSVMHWYKLVLTLTWNGSDYGNSATLKIYDGNSLMATAYPVTQDANFINVDKVSVMLMTGGTGSLPRGTCFLDDFKVTGADLQSPNYDAQAPRKENFDNFQTGVFLTQSLGAVAEWIPYGSTGLYERPMVTATRSFSGSKSISNENDSQSSTEENTTIMQGYMADTVSGREVTFSYMFYRTVEESSPTWNKVRIDVYGTTGERIAVGAYNNRIYNENNDATLISNLSTNTWYKLLLTFSWNGSNYGNSAVLKIYDSSNNLIGTAYPTTQTTNLTNIDYVTLTLRSGSTRGTCFVDDIEVTGARFRNPDFGRLWIREKGFTATALTLDDDYLSTYDDAGMNKLFGWEHKDAIYQGAIDQNLPWFIYAVVKDTSGDPDVIGAKVISCRAFTNSMVSLYPNCEAMLVWDEVKPWELDYLADNVRWVKMAYSENLVYTNLNAYNTYGQIGYDYSDHVTNVINKGVDVVGADAYPYFDNESSTTTYISDRYFATMESLRNRALSAGIPYWFFVQSTDEGSYRLPSQSDLRMNMFAPLAYGFTGLQFYYYWSSDANGIIGSNGYYDTSGFSHYVEDAMSEVAYFGRSLPYLESKYVRYVKSQSANTLPSGTTEFTGPIGEVNDIDIGTAGTNNNAVLGYFEDDNGDDYFMLVNVKRAKDTSAWDTRLDFTIHFSASVTSLYKMNRDTGLIEYVPITNGSVTLTILGGTGELFKINSYSFVGLPLGQTMTLFTDGFESGNFTTGGWTTQNGDATVTTTAKYTGTYGAKLAGTTWIQKMQSTTGTNTIHVKYDRNTAGMDSGEYLYVEWSVDGSTWNNLETTNQTSWASKDFTCAAGANNNANFRIRFRTNTSVPANEYAYVDNVVITGIGQ